MFSVFSVHQAPNSWGKGFGSEGGRRFFLCHGTRCELRNCNCKPFHIWGTNRDLYHAQLNFFSGASLEDYGRS